MVFAQKAKYLQVQTTMESSFDAERISNALVKKKLAACVQTLGPVTSQYHWEGKIERVDEFMLLIKTKADNYDKVEAVIREIHPYDTPEIIAIPIEKGFDKYLKWIETESSGDGE